MAEVTITGANLGNALQRLLLADDIEPGSSPSYETCRVIYVWHPLGAKMVDSPISAALSQTRQISVPNSPEERVKEAFIAQWEKDGIDTQIFNTARLARIYGISSVAVLGDDDDVAQPLDFKKLWDKKIAFNVFDPLNTAGSLVLNQDPNAMDFQKHTAIRVSGKTYHRSRSVTIQNESPLYIEYTPSAFGFVGRSVYQRALFPLKSFINTMVTDDMVAKKAGLIIAFVKSAGSIIDNMMQAVAGIKRSLLKIAVVDNVLSMGPDDKVESLNLQNLDGAFGNSRTNILKNIATAADMPAVMLENETLTEGFGEGTEDAKIIVRYVNRIRLWMKPLYDFFDPIVMRRAWNPDFYKTIQSEFPEEYAGVDYETAFFQWQESFVAVWPNLLEEPESERIQVEDVKFKALIATAEVIGPLVDPENKARVISWVAENMNSNKLLFGTPLILDEDALAQWTPQHSGDEGEEKVGFGEPKPFSAADAYAEAVKRLPLRPRAIAKASVA